VELLDYYTDGPKHRDGVWVELGTARLLLAPMDNPAYKAFTQEAKIKRGKGKATEEDIRTLLEEAVAHTVVRGWEGVELNGEAVEYSPEFAIRAFRALPGFLDTVVTLAYEEERYREDEVEDVLEQLRPTSAGASNGAAKSSGSKS